MAIDRVRHAEGTRKQHLYESEVAKLGKDLKKHPALAELKNVQKAEAGLKAAQEQLAKLAGQQTPEFAAAEKAVQKAQESFAAAGKNYESLRADYQAKKDRLATATRESKQQVEAGIKWRFATTHDSALILAGKTVVVGGEGEVIALDADTGKPRLENRRRGRRPRARVRRRAPRGEHHGGQNLRLCGCRPRAVAASVTSAAPGEPFPKDELSERYAAAAEAILKQTGHQARLLPRARQ